jgi:hypothetical protein
MAGGKRIVVEAPFDLEKVKAYFFHQLPTDVHARWHTEEILLDRGPCRVRRRDEPDISTAAL